MTNRQFAGASLRLPRRLAEMPALDRLRPLGTWWRERPLIVRDAVPAVLFAGLAFTPGAASEGMILAYNNHRPLDALGLLLLFAQCLPLVLRRTRPAWCLGIIAAGFALHELLGYPATFASDAIIIALYSAGAHQERGRRVLAVAATVAYAALSAGLIAVGAREQQPVNYFTFYLFLAACCAVGVWMRSLARKETERRRLAAELAIAEERARIARELHDVVTHHVTSIVAQADASRLVMSVEPDQAAAGLAAIGDVGRRTLTELRYFLGVLDSVPDADRAPSVGRLSDLVESARSSGQPAELTEEGVRPPMTSGAELAAYRVVQEALTNAVKHAAGYPTAVRVRYGTDVDIEVSTGGPVVAGFRDGRGLTGLRERVSVVGGELRAGGRPDGGFTVRARIPVGSEP